MINYEIPTNCIIEIGYDIKLLENVLNFLEKNTIIKWFGISKPTTFNKDYYNRVNYLIIKNGRLEYSNTKDFVKITYPYNTFPLIVIPYIPNDLFYD